MIGRPGLADPHTNFKRPFPETPVGVSPTLEPQRADQPGRAPELIEGQQSQGVWPAHEPTRSSRSARTSASRTAADSAGRVMSPRAEQSSIQRCEHRAPASAPANVLPARHLGCLTLARSSEKQIAGSAFIHVQLRTRSPWKPSKSLVFDVMRVRSLTCAIAAICPSTNGGVLPVALRRARSSACQSAASLV